MADVTCKCGEVGSPGAECEKCGKSLVQIAEEKVVKEKPVKGKIK